MEKHQLLKVFDDELLEKLYNFCYSRTADSHEAQELCSDIVFALVKLANTEGEIGNVYPFIWKVARNVYADHSENRRKRADRLYDGDPDDILPFIADTKDGDDDDAELLGAVWRRIAFLTRAYREAMILFYIDGLTTAEIAERGGTSEVAIRQRLFTARQKLKSEVMEMTDINNKPVALDKIDFVIWGDGRPGWGDPRDVCTRQFSKHIVWLCHKKPMTASEISKELNVPTIYVEEELEVLEKGKNGKYGLLRRLDSGKYALNFILFDKDVMEKANAVYTEQLPKICDAICAHIGKHRDEYLAFPYLNKKVDINLILWQKIKWLAATLSRAVSKELAEKYFSDIERPQRPFSVFGYVDNGKYYGGGMDGTEATNLCGFSRIYLINIYNKRIKPHFHCNHNISTDAKLQLALRAIDGLDVASLSEDEKEYAAKAIECGYLFREGNMLYTKILTCDMSNYDSMDDIGEGLVYPCKEIEALAGRLARLIHRTVPEYLIGEWRFANALAGLPVQDAVVDELIARGVLTPPEDGVGAEGCWMCVER